MAIEAPDFALVGKAMRQARQAAGLSLRQAAPLLGVDVTTLSRYERGQLEVPLHIIGLASRVYKSVLPILVWIEQAVRLMMAAA